MDVTQYSFYIDEEEDEVFINVENLKKSGKICIPRRRRLPAPHDGQHAAEADQDLLSADESWGDSVCSNEFSICSDPPSTPYENMHQEVWHDDIAVIMEDNREKCEFDTSNRDPPAPDNFKGLRDIELNEQTGHSISADDFADRTDGPSLEELPTVVAARISKLSVSVVEDFEAATHYKAEPGVDASGNSDGNIARHGGTDLKASLSSATADEADNALLDAKKKFQEGVRKDSPSELSKKGRRLEDDESTEIVEEAQLHQVTEEKVTEQQNKLLDPAMSSVRRAQAVNVNLTTTTKFLDESCDSYSRALYSEQVRTEISVQTDAVLSPASSKGFSSDTVEDKMADQGCQTSFLFVPSVSRLSGDSAVASNLCTPRAKLKVCHKESKWAAKTMSGSSRMDRVVPLPKENIPSATQKSVTVTSIPVRSRSAAQKGGVEQSSPFKCPNDRGTVKTPTSATKGKSPASSGKKTKAFSPWTVESPVAKYIHENPVPHLVHAVKPQKPAPSKAFSGVPTQVLVEMASPSRPIVAKKYQSSNKGLPLKATLCKHYPSQPFVMKHTAPADRNMSNGDIEASMIHVLAPRRLH